MLLARHGPMLTGAALANALGHVSTASLRQARRRGTITVALFTLPQRRGYFALTHEVAAWIAQARLAAVAELANPSQKGDATSPSLTTS